MQLLRAAIRATLACLLLATIAGCDAAPSSSSIDRIELRLSGWSALDVQVTRRGQGRFHRSHPLPEGRDGSFSITPRQFELLRERLEPFRREAEPVTAESIQQFIERRCPPGVLRVTDTGAVYVRWVGPGLDQHYLADLGCDPERNAARNRELLDIVGTLPIPAAPEGP